MYVTEHARERLTHRLGAVGEVIADALELLPGAAGDVAYEVHRYAAPIIDSTGSNGDSVVVIVREGSVETVMLRRSWNQPYTPAALGVSRCERMPA